MNRRSTFGAISLSGSTAEHRPACATETGHAPDNAAGFVLGDYAAAGIDDIRGAAGSVRAHAGENQRESCSGPTPPAADENSGSTAGLQKLIGGSSPSAILMLPAGYAPPAYGVPSGAT